MMTNQKSDFFDLGPDRICQAAEHHGGRSTGRFFQLNAMENRVYQVEMEDESFVIVKFYRPGRWSESQLLCEHLFLKKLTLSEVPVVAPIADPTGKTLFQDGDIYFVLFPRQGGRLEPELNHEQLRRLGRYLARIHAVGATVDATPRLNLNAKSYGLESIETLRTLKHLDSVPGQRWLKLAESICSMSAPALDKARTALTHGDCHGGNVLWRGDSPHFIDFDDMLSAPPVQDFWMLIGGSDDYARRNLAVLVKAYEELRPFDYSTIRLIEPLRALRMMHFSAWIARRWDDGAFRKAFPYFGTENYWLSQVEDLSSQLERLGGSNPFDDVGNFEALVETI